jgi:hypothetical protein
MSNNFNLLLLNDIDFDKHPRTWICIKGEKIKGIIAKIEKEIINKRQITREQISRDLAKFLNCNNISIKNILRGKSDFYPIPIILELCKFTNDGEFYRNIIEKSTEYFKVNSASAKPFKASKSLSLILAKILGAFCADGSLSMQFVISTKNKEKLQGLNILGNRPAIKQSPSRNEYYLAIQMNRRNYEDLIKFSKENKGFQTQTHYAIELTDEHKSNVEAFNRWICEEFEIKPTVFYNKENAYRTVFSNKILARYLIKFFDILPGYKSDIVDEPKIIRESNLDIRKEFAKGTLMFDGCVTKHKKIMFSSSSPYFANSIKEILIKDNLKLGSFKNKRDEYVVYTTLDNKTEKLLNYFEKGTKKWELLMWLSNKDFSSAQVTYEKDLRQAKNILEILKEIRSCDAEFLMNRLSYTHTTIRQSLLILKLKGLIKLSNHPAKISKYLSDRTTIFLKNDFHNFLFNRILERFKSYEEFSAFLEIPKANLSSWKLKKNRLSLKVLREMCNSLEIPFTRALEKVYETDREIAEII